MSAIEDVLAKPIWPDIDNKTQELIVAKLAPLCLRGTDENFKVGFNDVMISIEEGKAKALFVARSDLDGSECMPLALASAAQKIKLVALPKGSRERLGTGVAALCSCNDSSLLQYLNDIDSVRLDWVYNGVKLIPRGPRKKNAVNKDKKSKS